jgi:hypothetical protein
MDIENLLPREAYEIDETGYRKRLPWFLFISFAGLCGTMMTITLAIVFEMGIAQAILTYLVVGVLGGGYASFFSWIARRSNKLFTDKLYRGDLKFDVPPPATKNLKYRLVCSWIKSNKLAIGGVLYIGKDLLLFVPHKHNPPKHSQPFEIAPLENLTLGLAKPRRNLIDKILIPKPRSFIEIKWLEHSARFSVPQPLETLSEIESKIAFLKE